MKGTTKVVIAILAMLALAVVGFNAVGLAGQVSPQVDISGPCDEAEHANDPRCTGGAVGEDNSGPGSTDDGDHEIDADDDADDADDDEGDD